MRKVSMRGVMHMENITTTNPTTGLSTIEPRGAHVFSKKREDNGEWQQRVGIVDAMVGGLKAVIQMSPLCAEKSPGGSQWTPAYIGRKSLISVMSSEHAFEIEELLECVLVLRIGGVLTRFHHHRIIGSRGVSDAKGPRWQNVVATPGNSKLDWWNGVHVEFVARKQLTLASPCTSCFPRRLWVAQRHVVQRASAERRLCAKLVTWWNRVREINWHAGHRRECARCWR